MSAEEMAERVAQALWYHSIELPGGVVTPGDFDLRPALERMASDSGLGLLDRLSQRRGQPHIWFRARPI